MTGHDAVTELKELANSYIKSGTLREIVLSFVLDARFALAPGGSSHHHTFEGGLAIHTLEVVETVISMTNANENAVAAAMMHDFAKVYEYDIVGDKIIKLPFSRLVGHVVYSWYLFMRRAHWQLDQETIDEISHAMLAHHGRREWGSPVEPQTDIAFALHSADMLSMQAGKEAMKK